MRKDKNRKQKENQIEMNLPKSRFELLFKFKRFVKNIEKNFTVLPFWQNGFLWFAIISTFGLSILSIAILVKNYSNLPPVVPFIYDTQEENWQSLPRIVLFSLPISLFILGFINIRFLQKVYYMNKKMTLMICFIIGIVNIFQFLAINEIILLTTR